MRASTFSRRPIPCVLLGILAAALIGCAAEQDPERAIEAAEVHLQAGEPAAAERIVRDALADSPQDPRLRIVLARTELASGNASAAEGSLLRAMALGGNKSEVTGHLAQAMLAQGDAARALELIGDLEQWPREHRVVLAISKTEAELSLPNFNRRDLTKHAVGMFRLRAETRSQATAADVTWSDSRLAELRSKHELIEGAYEHFACGQESRGQDARALSPPQRIAATRRVLKVGPSHALRRPSDAARVAQDNDVIEIEASRYERDVALWTQNGLLLRGVNGRPHLASQGRTAMEQGIWVFRGNDIVVENIEFSGARSRSKNGSGIRFFGRNLTVRDSYFHDNEDGVLTWHDAASDILIERSKFERNGHGDGQSHNIYIGRIRSFTLRWSHSHDSISGHEVKSRARVNYIIANRLTDEGNGNSSYLIDLPEGGYGYVLGNVLEKGSKAENPNAISFASEAADLQQGGLWVVNNSFYNRYLDVTFVANRSKLPVMVANNVLAGAPALLLSGPGTDLNNFRQPNNGMIDAASYDFHLKPNSPLIDAGKDPGGAGEVSLWPPFEYVHPAGGRERQRVGAIDIGAHEFCGW